jgi:flagellar export protein FliJ
METRNLNVLISLATTARDAAVVQRAQAQQQLDAARAQLEALHGYAREYGRRARDQLTNGCDRMAQTNARAFNGRLEEAIAAQLQETQRREKQFGHADAQWRELASRVQRLELLAARREQAARERARRHEQKLTDELARNAVQRRGAALGTDR